MPSYNVNGLMLDPSHPLSRGLVGWWPMLEGAGERVGDISPYRNNGLFKNMAIGSTSGWRGGIHGRSIQTDASDDRIEVAHSASLTLAAEFSVSIWVQLFSLANYPTFIMKGNGGAGYPNPFHFLYESGGNYFVFTTGNGTNQNQGANTGGFPAPSLYRWYHLVAVHTGGSAVGAKELFYYNGVLTANYTTVVAVSDAGTALNIGGRNPGTLYGINGYVSNARVWNRALTTDEARMLYHQPWAGALSPARASKLTYVPVPSTILSPETSDRLWNHGYARRIFRRGERITS